VTSQAAEAIAEEEQPELLAEGDEQNIREHFPFMYPLTASGIVIAQLRGVAEIGPAGDSWRFTAIYIHAAAAPPGEILLASLDPEHLVHDRIVTWLLNEHRHDLARIWWARDDVDAEESAVGAEELAS